MLFTPHPVPVTPGEGYARNGPRPDALGGSRVTPRRDAARGTPEARSAETGAEAATPRTADHAAAGARDGDGRGLIPFRGVASARR